MDLNFKQFREWSPYDIVGCLLVFVQMLSAVFPAFILVGNNAIVCLATYVLWFCIAFLQSRHTLLKIVKRVWYVIPYMVYVAFAPYLFGNGSIGNRYMNLFGFIFGIWIFMYYQERQRLDVIKNAILMALPFFLLTLCTTMMAGLENAYIIRQVEYNESSAVYLLRNIGGYHFIYAITPLSVVLFAAGLRATTNGDSYILLSVVWFALTVVSNFFTAVVVCIIGFGLVLVCYLSQNKKVGLLTLKIVVPLVLIFGGFLKDAFVSLFDEGGRIYRIIAGDEPIISALFAEFMADRAPTIVLSIDAFLEHPIFGLVFHEMATDGVYYTGFGQHSYIFDTFALYGIGIGIIATIIIFLPITKVNAIRENLIFALPLFFTIALIAIFNNVTNQMAVVTTIVCPYICMLEHEMKMEAQ